ncbi:MAG: hypothetical protein Q7W56_10170 [Candidatus Latescibacteria bacterium]|nr:hypothetical protein [Candidatus Latescibacterota bacterium]
MPHAARIIATRTFAARLLLMVGFALAVTTLPVAAQPVGQEQAAEVLQITADVLQEVGPLVQESQSEQARRIFAEALQKQQQAGDLYRDGRYMLAARLSLRAREMARQAARVTGASQGYQERVQQRLERVGDLLDSVRDRARDAGHVQALRFVRDAEDLVARAREQARQTHYEQAFRLLETAEKMLGRAARLLYEEGDGERLRLEIERTADLIAEARDRLGEGGDQAPRIQLDRAQGELERARAALDQGEPMRAMHAARHARELVRQVLRQIGGGPGAEIVEAQLDRFDAQLPAVVDAVTASGSAEARQALERATDTRHRAGAALEAGDRDQALRLVRTALDHLNRAEALGR